MKIYLFLLFILPSILLANKKGEEIAELNLKSRGGKAAIGQLVDFRFETSTLSPMTGIEENALLMFSDSAFFVEQYVKGRRTVFAHNNKYSWFIAPFMGVDSAVNMSPQLKVQFESQFRQTLSFMKGIFYGYKQDSITVDYIDDIEEDGKKYHKLKLYRKNSDLTVEVWVDTKTNFESKLIINAPRGVTTIVFENHKIVKDIYFPHLLKTYLNGQHLSTLTFNEIILNEGLDPNIFEKPAE